MALPDMYWSGHITLETIGKIVRVDRDSNANITKRCGNCLTDVLLFCVVFFL